MRLASATVLGQTPAVSSSWPPAPAAPPPPEQGWRHALTDAPRALRPVLVLLLVNLALSVVLTIAVAVARHSIVTFQLDARHITDPALRAQLTRSYSAGIVSRGVGNIVASVVYVFLVRALLNGRRWAYRRVLWLGSLGVVALLALQVTPYPWWMHAEQLLQAVVLGALLYFVTRPAVRAHFASGLPGRDVGRFRRPPPPPPGAGRPR
jgi:hypothetical protein